MSITIEEDEKNIQQQTFITKPGNFQHRYILSRAEAVASIEKTMSELQTIFQQLANIVQEQGELIERYNT